MNGALNTLTEYDSRYGGKAYKGIVVAEDEFGKLHNWSIQIYPTMDNYKHWKDIVETKMANPHNSIYVDNLSILNREKKQLTCDRKPRMEGLYPVIKKEQIDRVNGKETN